MNDMLRLNLNEFRADTKRAWVTYPEPMRLVRAFAGHLGVPQECILPVAGAAQGLDVVTRSRLGVAIMPTPCFPLTAKLARDYGKATILVPVRPGGEFPADEILRHARDQAPSQVILSIIENPTGIVTPASMADRLQAEAPNAEFVADEVYSRFLGQPTLYAKRAASTPGVISIISMSKWGYAGLRVGCVVATPDRIAAMKPFVSAFAIAAPSIDLAVRALSRPDRIDAGIRRQHAARELLVAGLEQRGIRFIPTPANWVLVDFGTRATAIAAALKVLGIAVQVPDHSSLTGLLRVSTPGKSAMKAFLSGLDSVLAV